MNKKRSSSRRVTAAEAAPGAAESATVFDWVQREGAADRVINDLGVYVCRRRRRRVRAVTAAAAILLVGVLAWRPWHRGADAPVIAAVARDAVVLRPAQRTLPDGTVVDLNAGAEIAVDFSGPLRRVALLRGEGHFQVAKNPQRPFVVSAGGIEVRAVGTAFAVARAAEQVEVLVTEGRVAIEQPTLPAPAVPAVNPVSLGMLDAGGRIVVTPANEATSAGLRSEISTISARQIGERLAWREPRLEFAATPLARVVVLFNEHAAARGGDRLILSDPALGRVQLSGVLRADDVESLLRVLEVEFQIRAERQGNVITLRRG